jgi:hypothetical protein
MYNLSAKGEHQGTMTDKGNYQATGGCFKDIRFKICLGACFVHKGKDDNNKKGK